MKTEEKKEEIKNAAGIAEMLTANVKECSAEESEEILDALSLLTEEDLSISSSGKIELS